MPNVSAHYEALAASGDIERDHAQEIVAGKLTRLEASLAEHRLARKSSALGWLFASRQRRDPEIKGLYIHGEVGRGKTMLMDMFFARSAIARKRRAHFHEFMSEAHERIHAFRQRLKRGEIAEDDPVRLAATALAAETSLLCFDEFQVTDIADAMILGRLFARLFELNVVVVATSNVAPHELYRDGLNRALFLPFIKLIEEWLEVVHLPARTDFRLEKLGHVAVWHGAADCATQAALEEAWHSLTSGEPGGPIELTVKGRKVAVPKAALGVAWFSFDELCGQPLGAADYLKIAREFHTLIIENIPVMGYERRNEARRFVALIDTLYDNAVKVIASASAEPDRLYEGSEGNEAHEFRRTASRLMEMRSQDYLALPHGKRVNGARLEGIVET